MLAAEFFRRYDYRLGKFRDAQLAMMYPRYQPSQEMKDATRRIVVIIPALFAGVSFKASPTLGRLAGAGAAGYIGTNVTASTIKAITIGRHIQITRVGDFQEMTEGRK